MHHLLMLQSRICQNLNTHFVICLSLRSLDSVSDEAKAHFRESAEKILATRDAVDALSAALACISGTTNIIPRSLLTKKEVQ
jgi:hypothetical protein